MSVDLFTDDLEALQNDELYDAIEEFAAAQPVEGWRLDYTQQWDDSSLKTVASFANTFGGLLIVGVKKDQNDIVCELPGVESKSEYKTRIASAIATNISPAPSYKISECLKPGTSDRRFCVVRVRESGNLHLITKKDFDPTYVRNEDETRKANSADLRRLIDRQRESPTQFEKMTERANRLRDAMIVKYDYGHKDSERWYLGPCRQSETFLKLQIVPSLTVPLELEKSHEERLGRLIYEFYPRFYDTVAQDVAKQADGRHASYYEYTAYHKNLDYESRWRITESGDIGHATQMRYESDGIDKAWSVVDLTYYVILFLRLAMKWWHFIGYFGEGYLHAQLSVDALNLLRHPRDGYYVHAFDPTYSPVERTKRLDIRKDAISVATSSGSSANSEAKLTYFSDDEKLATLTTSTLNRLLRSLGHVVDKEKLQTNIESIVQGLRRVEHP
jgi:hypothetical protein